jgi:hypothetical protein
VPAAYAPTPKTPAPTLLVIACVPDKHDQWPSHADLVRTYACPADEATKSARDDALTPRIADW